VTPAKRLGALSVGNVLMGNDAIGLYIPKILESRYELSANVVLDDLGTPGLGITSCFSDNDAVIAVELALAAIMIELFRLQVIPRLRPAPINPSLWWHDRLPSKLDRVV